MCPHNAIPHAKVPSRCNSARESALFPQAAPCPFSILGRTLPHISIAKSVYVYIRTGVATVLGFRTYIYVRKSERINRVYIQFILLVDFVQLYINITGSSRSGAYIKKSDGKTVEVVWAS